MEHIEQINRNLWELMMRPLIDRAKERNRTIEDVIHKPITKIKGKRKCVRCHQFVPIKNIVKRNELFYCKKCDKIAVHKPRRKI